MTLHRTAIATLNGIEACRRMMVRRPDDLIKSYAPRYDLHEGTLRIRNAAPDEVLAWVLLSPHDLGITVSVRLRESASADVATWSADYPRLSGEPAADAAVPEDQVDTDAILSQIFRRQLEHLVEQALAVLPAPASARQQAAAHV